MVGKTEKHEDKLDVIFETPLTVNYMFEKKQTVKVEIYDYDGDKVGSDDDDLIGEFSAPVNKILTAHKQTVKGELRLAKGRSQSENRGRVALQADSVENSNNRVKMTIRTSLIPKKT